MLHSSESRFSTGVPVRAARQCVSSLRAVCAAFVLPLLKRHLGPDRLVAAAVIGTAAALILFGLARQPPIAVRYIISAINKGLEMPFTEACVFEASLFGLLAATDDMREGTRAFLEKRKPVFTGK